MRAYVFVDGENHFLRSCAALEQIGGDSRAAQALSLAKMIQVPGIVGFPRHIDGGRFGWSPDLQLFWDCELLARGGALRDVVERIDRAIYASSCTGDEDKAHEMRVKLRSYEFEPLVVIEPKDLRRRREEQLQNYGLIEKPKGCDISLATRMVADAAAGLYDACLLFTSDADFLPAIEAIRRMGKVVCVYGYSGTLPARSPYLHVPDRFIDLQHHLQGVWQGNQAPIQHALESISDAAAAEGAGD